MSRRIAILAAASLTLPVLFRTSPAAAFSGAGSSFAYPILARWGRAFGTQRGEGGPLVVADSALDYEAVGSVAGVMRVLQGAVDFAASDVALPPEEVDRHRLAQFPFVSGGIAVVTSLPAAAGRALRLSGPVLADIYLGRVRHWRDPAIERLNPGLPLPDATILVVGRSDGSGTTHHFTAYLSAASEAWRDGFGAAPTIAWPTGIGARGNREVGTLVQTSPNAIGYVEAGRAARLGLPVVRLGTAEGGFVGPEPVALRAALAGTRLDPARHFHHPGPLPQGAGAYPIVTTAYALMPRRAGGRRRAITLAFFRAALTEGAADAAALGYVPLPEPLVGDIIGYWHDAFRR